MVYFSFDTDARGGGATKPAFTRVCSIVAISFAVILLFAWHMLTIAKRSELTNLFSS